jgi:signal transduction histidine kinase
VTVRDEQFEQLLGAGAPLVAAAFDALPDAIGVVWPVVDGSDRGLDFAVGYTNPSADRMMGVPLSSEIGARLREVMPGVVEMGLFDRLLRVSQSGLAESAEIVLDTMWRGTIHVEGVWVHTVLPFGPGLLSVAFDVTAERRREKELRDFAAVAAHDLREPLIGIGLLAGLLARNEGLSAKEQEVVKMLDDGVVRARGLVDSILDYAMAEGEHVVRTQVDCEQVVVDVLASLSSQIEGAGGRVEVDDLPTLLASRTGLARVFQNLIANAIKFHDDAAPLVRISASDDGSGWAFAVRDNGIGLPQSKGIFEMFTRASDREGSGIGLATCRRIVEGHGGRIWAESPPGGGSTFMFTVPHVIA